MQNCLLTHFIHDKEIKGSCDFNQFAFENHLAVYEVIRVVDGIPLFLEDHLNRFFASLKINRLETHISKRQIKSRLRALVQVNKLSIGNIRFQMVFTPGGDAGFYAWVAPFFYPTKEQYKSGIDCSLYAAERPTPNSKTALNKLRKETTAAISNKGVFEVLLCNRAAYVTEGSKSNVFFVKGNKVYTPPAATVLPGVTREKVFSLCNSLKVTIMEENIKTHDINNFDAAFLSGTSIKLLPIKSIEDKDFKVQNRVVELLTIKYEELMVEHLNNFKWNL
jgi:branched-chain amino acid aminotransferase